MRRLTKLYKIGIPFMLLILLISGCSVTHSVNTSATTLLSKQLKEEIPALKKSSFTFTRPDLTINIKMKDILDEEAELAIMEKVKTFSTISNMSQVAESVKWNIEISEIHVIISNPSNEEETVGYFSRYFNTNDASNKSEENIDAYTTWYKYE